MTRMILSGAAIAAIVWASPAEARHHYYSVHNNHSHRAHVRYRHHVVARHGGGKPSCFWTAASMGGPCGCWAAYVLLGKVEHVWHGINLWLADDWLKFPHVSMAEATAVVWPHRHVAPTVPGTYQNGTIVVRDSWATHRVRTAGLIGVRPGGAPERLRWPSSVPL
jgi:hypothetical protein